jgi:hypothetical protein
MNAINVTFPYRHHGMWVFDDSRVGLMQEPLVAGTDRMIDRVVTDIPNAERGFTLIFSGAPFPGHQIPAGRNRLRPRPFPASARSAFPPSGEN